jgi:hypothetical protein
VTTVLKTGFSKLWDVSGRLFFPFNRMRRVEHFGLLNINDGVPFELWNVKGETHFGLSTVLIDHLLNYGM